MSASARNLLCFLAFLTIFTATTAWADPILQISSGKLTGALNVNVGGTFYDVQFRDGTCIALFNQCDAVSDFTFQSQATADMASQALLSQVLIDGPGANDDF